MLWDNNQLRFITDYFPITAQHQVFYPLHSFFTLSDHPGHFGIPAGLVFSVPVTFQKGEWSACSDVIITKELQRNLEAAVNEITVVRDKQEGKEIKESLLIKNGHDFTFNCVYFSVHLYYFQEKAMAAEGIRRKSFVA